MSDIKEQAIKTFQDKLSGLGFNITDTDNHIAEAIEELENQLENEKDQRKEERFYWFVFTLFLANLVIFPEIENIPLVILQGIIEIIAIILLAEKLGVKTAVMWFKRIADVFDRNKKH